MVLVAFVSAGISGISFVMSSQYIERLKGGVSVNSWDWKMILSAFLPHYTELSSEIGGTEFVSVKNHFAGFEINLINQLDNNMGMLNVLIFDDKAGGWCNRG